MLEIGCVRTGVSAPPSLTVWTYTAPVLQDSAENTAIYQTQVSFSKLMSKGVCVDGDMLIWCPDCDILSLPESFDPEGKPRDQMTLVGPIWYKEGLKFN